MSDSRPPSLSWQQDHLRLLDQRVLPESIAFIDCHTAAEVAAAISAMVVRGAPAIGIAAAYGYALAARQAHRQQGRDWRRAASEDIQGLRQSRPTAVNLNWALQHLQALPDIDDADPFARLLAEARALHQRDMDDNRRMGELGAALLPDNCRVMTHCNAGALATADYGTALGVIRAASDSGKLQQVYAGETRPWLQGARLTAWELLADDIPVTLLADSAAAWLMQQGHIDWVITGADRIAANGDVANKIGTCQLAVAARHFGVRMMVVAPTSTIDWTLSSGAVIPIEERSGDELLHLAGKRIAASGATAWNPVFDVTPAELVDVLVSEQGVLSSPTVENLRQWQQHGHV